MISWKYNRDRQIISIGVSDDLAGSLGLRPAAYWISASGALMKTAIITERGLDGTVFIQYLTYIDMMAEVTYVTNHDYPDMKHCLFNTSFFGGGPLSKCLCQDLGARAQPGLGER